VLSIHAIIQITWPPLGVGECSGAQICVSVVFVYLKFVSRRKRENTKSYKAKVPTLVVYIHFT